MGISYSDLFAANIRSARARAGLSQTAVAARMQHLGFTSWDGSKVSRCERGALQVPSGELLALAVALECAISELIGATTAPDVLVSFPAGAEISGVSIRNSAYGWRDQSTIWEDDQLRILRPADPQSARVWDKASIIAITDPARLARRAS